MADARQTSSEEDSDSWETASGSTSETWETTSEEAATSADEDATQELVKSEPSVRELNKLAQKLAGCWYSLAIQLGLDKDSVDNIDLNNAYPTPVRKASHALVKWHNEFSHDATYERLAEALRRVGRGDLAQRFCSYQVNSKRESTHGQHEKKQSPPATSTADSQSHEEQTVKKTRTVESSLGPSSPPQNVTARSNGPTSILVQWDEVPQDDRNGLIERYVVVFKEVKNSREERRSVNAPTQHLELSSLEKFSKYDIRVLGVTAAGAGPASSALTVMTSEKGVPSEIELDNLSKEITLCWESVGIQLGLRQEVIDNITANNVQNPRPEQKAYSMLIAWRNQGSASTWDKLSKALICEKKYDLAQMFWPVQSADGHQVAFGSVAGLSFPPQNVKARSNGPTSILVQWDKVPQDDGNGNIKGYDVVFQDLKSGKEDIKRVNAPATRLELSSLEKFRKYDISVLAFTALGTGPASPVIKVMTGEKEFEQLRCQLAQFYEESMCEIQVAPWDPDDTVHVDEVYTRLSWSRENKQLSGTKEEELDDYTDIFLCSKGSANPKRIVVYGQGGIGKSTFSQKLSVDWARGEVEALKKFDLLLVIKLRDVCGEVRDLKEMIVQSGLLPCDEPAQVDCLLKCISENQDRVLILFDGFDEYDKTRDTQSDVYKIITGKMHRGCHVVVTTRPVKLDELKKFMQAQCKINGFIEEDIRKFASKYVGEDQCDTFMNYLWEQDLLNMASIPLMLLFLCLLWKEKKDQPLPSTRTQIFQKVTQCIIDHCQVKQSPDNLKSTEEYSETLCKIGKVAFEALLQDSLVFDTALLSKEVLSDDIVRLGFLSMSKVQHQRSKLMASFFHKSVQEFLAAWYIAKQPWISTLEPLQDFSTAKNCQACLEFVCGLSADGANTVFLHLQKIREKESLVPKCDVARSYLDFDSNQIEFQNFCRTMFLKLDCKEAFVGAYLDCVGGVVQFYDTIFSGKAVGIKDSGGQLLSLLLRHDSLVQLQFVFHASDPDKMKVMKVFDQEDVRTVTWASGGQSKGSELLETTTKEQQFLVLRKETVLYLCYDVPSDVSFTPELVRLFQPPASDQSPSESEASEPENGQKFDTNQQSSALENELPVHALSFVTKAHFEYVPEDTVWVEILKNAPYLTSLNLSNNPFGAGVSVLASQLENLPKLKELHLENTGMSEREAADLSRALVHIPHLTRLSLSSNTLRAGVSVLASQLENLPKLKVLDLENTEMSEREAADLSRALVHIPHLTHLWLGSNPLGAGVSVLASQLENLPKLEWLDLEKTEMSEREAADLSRALVHIPHVDFLSLGSNPLGVGVSDLASQLENLPKLEKLDLNNTEMSEREAADLSRALVHVPHLMHLDLEDNPLVGRGVICLAKQIVTHVPELQWLHLHNTGMDDECKAALVKAKQNRKKAGGEDFNIAVDGVNGEQKYL